MEKNTPDNIVWDETHEAYFAKLLPYASNLGGPIISIPNVDAFKKKGVDKVSKQFQAELKDLQSRIKSFIELASETQKVYEALFKFEPIVGETYHLYYKGNQPFLSLIGPNEWDKPYIGSFTLDSNNKWVKCNR